MAEIAQKTKRGDILSGDEMISGTRIGYKAALDNQVEHMRATANHRVQDSSTETGN